MDRKVLGKNLKSMREALGMSQEFVSDATDIKQHTLSRLEGGDGGGLDALLALLNYYGKYFDLDGYLRDDFFPVEYSEANPKSNVFEMRKKLIKVITQLQKMVDGKEPT